jgi:tetratricopeptide (TPR) repeat protein
VDNSHRFSISYRIGTSVPEQARLQQEEEQQRGSQLLREERRRQFTQFKEKADQFYSEYRLDSALTYYQRALAFDENNQEIIGTIAAIESMQRYQREHEQDLRERQYELNLLIETIFEQARSFYARKSYPAALDMLDLILEIDPNHQPARKLQQEVRDAMATEVASNLQTAREARANDNPLEALDAYQRVLYLDPDNQEALSGKREVARTFDIARHLNVGIDLFKAGRYEEARKQFDLVLSVSPNEPVAMEYIRRIEDAEKRAPTLEEIQQNPAIWQLYLDGLRYMRNQQYEKAIRAWEKVLEAYPGNEATLNNIEQARLRLLSEDQQ